VPFYLEPQVSRVCHRLQARSPVESKKSNALGFGADTLLVSLTLLRLVGASKIIKY
jgi:hypothetical protein